MANGPFLASPGLSLASSVKKVIGIEICEPAVLDARANARRNKVGNATFITGKAEPVKTVMDGGNRCISRASTVGILDAEQIAATMVAGKQPVEKSRARPANMEKTGWRWRKARNHIHYLFTPLMLVVYVTGPYGHVSSG